MPKTLSNKLEDIIHVCRGRKEIHVGEFLAQLGTSGPAILTMLFSIPFLFFAWIPGLMMAFGVVIFLSGIRVALNKPIWVHKVLRRRKLSGDKMAHRLVRWVKCLKRFEKTIHPRGTIYQQSPFLQTFNGFILSLCGLFLFLPLSPTSNFLPALGVFLLSIGILEEDLWVIIAAYAVLIIKLFLLFIPIILQSAA
jgi:hypothetical protein